MKQFFFFYSRTSHDLNMLICTRTLQYSKQYYPNLIPVLLGLLVLSDRNIYKMSWLRNGVNLLMKYSGVDWLQACISMFASISLAPSPVEYGADGGLICSWLLHKNLGKFTAFITDSKQAFSLSGEECYLISQDSSMQTHPWKKACV